MKEKFLTYVFVNFKEARKVVRAMEILINEFGYASVADLNDFIGGASTYSEHSYGWTSLSGTTTTEVVHGGITRVEFPLPEPLEKECKSCKPCKECTDDRCTENRYGYTCPHCQSLNIREISGHHDEGAPYGTIGYECTDCHTTFTVDVFDEAALKKENERLKQELEETKKETQSAVEDLSCLCTMLDEWGECFAHSYVVHYPSTVIKDMLIEMVMKYSKNK
jgi:hypothetical protein